ncbi:uncharacterized protein [Antedon mediterranea]|uniref:uncharacterized protein n=1 Tax=Antedon mediterranea TaxID=105859 RepID=UPI003AF5D29F
MTGGTLLGMFCIILHVQVSSATLTPCKEVDFVYNCSHHLLQDVPKDLSPTIKYLILSHNQILKISADSFDGLLNLITIDVSYNDISKVAPGAFSKLPKLDTLTLKKTQLNKPEPGIFQGLTKLRFLDFSQIHPRLIKIPDNLFEDLISLEELKLDGNSLTSLNLGDNCALPTTKVLSLVNNTFTNLSNTDFSCFKNANLTRLLLSGNKLEYIEREAFSHFDSIQVLDVSGEILYGGISPGSIQNLAMALDGVKLQSLRLAHLRLVTLTDLMFKGLHNLTTLDLSNNWIKTFESACFSSLANLTRLDLYNNNITRIENQTFSALTSLQFLDMEKNNVSVIFSGFFVSLSKSNMSYINLKLNGVKRIEPGAFKGLTNLTQLELAENHINQELTGDEFDGLNELQILNIGANTYINLKSTAFSKVLNLKILILNKVQLRSIRLLKPSPFQVLKNVEILDLSNNNMNYVYADVFSGMTKLQKLYLNHNNLYLMLKTDDPVFFLNNLSSLLQLDLSSNGVSSIHSNTFVGLTRLMSLKLSHNKLMKLPNNLFKPTAGIEHLDLSNNKFNIFNQSMFDKIPHLKTMAAGGTNPFACTCDLEWFRNWINTSHVSIVDINECICDSPPSYRDKLILSFHPSDLNCDHIIPFYIWIISGSVLLILFVVAGVIYKKWYYLKYWCFVRSRKRRPNKKYQRLNPYTYNAFLSYSSVNEDWVKTMIEKIENEETGIKLCLHKRDFIVGRPIILNIIDSMDASYRTVCVITRAFLESNWCRQELQYALLSLFNERKDDVILIFLEEIPSKMLTKELKVHQFIKKFCKDTTYLEWPKNKEEIPLFWEKLKESITIDYIREQLPDETREQLPAREQLPDENREQLPAREQLPDENREQLPAREQLPDEIREQLPAREQLPDENREQLPAREQLPDETVS